MATGDQVMIYHTGDEKAIVGIMDVVSGPQSDPNDEDPKAVAVEVRPVKRLKNPVSLATIKRRLSRVSMRVFAGAQADKVLAGYLLNPSHGGEEPE